MSNKKSIDDILNDDEFGLLDAKPQTSNVKSAEDRLIDSFQEINSFFSKHGREPGKNSMSEYGLSAKLNNFRENEEQKKILKPFDKYDLLGEVDIEERTIDDILNDDDDMGLLTPDDDLSIFRLRQVPGRSSRSDSDFVAQRYPMKKEDFHPYEKLFHQVHNDLRNGRRKLKAFKNLEKNLQVGHYYLMDGLVLYLESADLDEKVIESKDGIRTWLDGRTTTIFENGTYSNMLYRSLGKQIQRNGKLITKTHDEVEGELFVNSNLVMEDDIKTGWIYVLKSKSTDPKIATIRNLYKIGFSSTPISERIKNARHESTYLFADVQKVASYACYNRNAGKLESLLHRFFAKACLNVDLFDKKGLRITPREWFVVPFEVIEEAIHLILTESIMDYEYDVESEMIKIKD